MRGIGRHNMAHPDHEVQVLENGPYNPKTGFRTPQTYRWPEKGAGSKRPTWRDLFKN